MRSPTEETIQLPVTRYRTPEGVPTCALDFKSGKRCAFLMPGRFGTMFYCGVRVGENVDRFGSGYMTPLDNCPLWEG